MKNILIIGDSCRDIFVYCNALRLAPDFPVPILNIVNQTENPGMAKNVYRNIQMFNDCDIITNPNWQEVTKTRYVHEATNHMFVRVDNVVKIPRINLDKIAFDYKLIVISDYNKGFLDESDIEYICKRHPNVFVDTKKILGSWAENAKYIKINDYEYRNSKPYLTAALEELIICTKGADGCVFRNTNYPVEKVDVRDTSGAGDSFMAGLCVKYLQTENIVESIKFANRCASEVVKHRGVTIPQQS
jgi:D-beta-D-heptose 7-phosphate kinase/D-beta-D-heptose 1-phosphate adenosyltransferase